MKPTLRHCRGFSLIELLVVLVIVGVLAVVGVMMIGNKPSGSVRTVMDELEGTLSGAHKLAVSTSRDVLLVTQGDWGGGAPNMMLAYGDATLGQVTILTNGLVAPEAFRVAVNSGGGLQREHMYAGVVTAATAAWWGTAGAGSESINAKAPFGGAGAVWLNLLTASPNLFLGGTTVGSVRISGANKRFSTTFWIEVVSLRDGQPIAGGPMGVIVVQANGAQIYKFYNPGVLGGGDGTWRRI